MKINRVKISQTIRKLAKIDYENIKAKTSSLDISNINYAKEKIHEINCVFRISAGDTLLRIQVLSGKRIFLRCFLEENLDSEFDFNISLKKEDLILIIKTETINETNLEELVKLMYVHSMIY